MSRVLLRLPDVRFQTWKPPNQSQNCELACISKSENSFKTRPVQTGFLSVCVCVFWRVYSIWNSSHSRLLLTLLFSHYYRDRAANCK